MAKQPVIIYYHTDRISYLAGLLARTYYLNKGYKVDMYSISYISQLEGINPQQPVKIILIGIALSPQTNLSSLAGQEFISFNPYWTNYEKTVKNISNCSIICEGYGFSYYSDDMRPNVLAMVSYFTGILPILFDQEHNKSYNLIDELDKLEYGLKIPDLDTKDVYNFINTKVVVNTHFYLQSNKLYYYMPKVINMYTKPDSTMIKYYDTYIVIAREEGDYRKSRFVLGQYQQADVLVTFDIKASKNSVAKYLVLHPSAYNNEKLKEFLTNNTFIPKQPISKVGYAVSEINLKNLLLNSLE